MELYRLLLVEIPLLGAVNRKSWNPDTDFLPTKGGIWMSEEGQRKMIALYERRLTETTKHPVLDYSLSYRRSLELETRLLEKEWSGSPGMFGQMRIR
jgi:CRISPR-associated protein Cas1